MGDEKSKENWVKTKCLTKLKYQNMQTKSLIQGQILIHKDSISVTVGII